MEKSTKWALRIIGGAALVGAGIYAIRSYRKKSKALEEQHEEIKTAVENAGTTEEVLSSETKEEDEPGIYIKSICAGTVFNDKFDFDVVDSDLAMDSENTIYVRDHDTDYGKNIEFLLRIPRKVVEKGNYSLPTLGNFKSSANEAAEYMWRDIVKNSPKARIDVMGILYYNEEEEDGERVSRGVEITEDMYPEYSEEQYPLNKFVELINKRLDEINQEESFLRPNETILKALGKTEENDISIEDAILCVRISFPVMFWSKKKQSYIGVNTPMAIDCINYLINSFEVYRRDANGNPIESGEPFTYDHILFLGTQGEGNLARYWNVENDKNGNPIIEKKTFLY